MPIPRLLLLIVLLLTLQACERSNEKAVLVSNAWLGTAPVVSAAVTHPNLLPHPFKVVTLVSDVSVLRMLSNEAAAGAFVTLDNALGLNTMTQGDYCVAMVLDRSYGADAILAREQWSDNQRSQIHVGLEDSTLARYVLSQWIKIRNILPERVTTQVLLPSEHLSAWTEAEVDLIVTYRPFIERLRQRGAKVIFDSQEESLDITDVLIINKQRWTELAPAVMKFRNDAWQTILRLLEREQREFWQNLQALTELGQEELRIGLATVKLVAADAQEQALQSLIENEIPNVSQHLIASEVYDSIYALERCDQLEMGN